MEVDRAIVEEMFQQHVLGLFPRSGQEVRDMQTFDFPYAFAALDGCHIPIKCPHDVAGRRDYYNYKNFYSIVLMALVDAKGRFIWAQAGMPGNVHDSTILQSTNIWHQLPDICHAAETRVGNVAVPGLILADSAFPFRTFIMKRFSHTNLTLAEKKFNKLHSRSRIVVENAFGLLKMKFRELFRHSERQPENVKYSALACLVLHNLTINLPPPATPVQNIEPPIRLNHAVSVRDLNATASRVRDAIVPLCQ